MQRCGLSWQCLSCHTLTPTEKSCFKAMNAVLARPPFRVWDQGRREYSTGQMVDRRADLNQPAVLTPWLMIGDLGDVKDLASGKLRNRTVTAVLNLCPTDMEEQERIDLRKQLASQGIQNYLESFAQDHTDYDIIQRDLASSLQFAQQVHASSGALLVNCYGGVNRSGAIVAALLMLIDKEPLVTAVTNLVAKRGYVLSNLSFRRQLVQLAAKHGLAAVPAELEAAPAELTTTMSTLGVELSGFPLYENA